MADQHAPTESGAQSTAQIPAYPPVDPRLLAAMYGMAAEDEIDLLAYWGIIRKRWKLIAAVMLAAAIISAGISLLMPNIYEAKVLMAPVNQGVSNSSRSGLSSTLGDFGGLASVAGINLGADSSNALQNLAVLKSRAFLWSFIQDNKLMPILFAKDWDASKKAWKKTDPKDQPSLWDAYRLLKRRVLSVSTDNDSGLVTVSVDWTNPTAAADWANRLATRLNDYLRNQAIARSDANLKYLNETLQKTSVADVRQTLFALIVQAQKQAMVANTQKQYAFQVLDPAATPDKKVRPHRSLIVLLSIFAAGFLSVVVVIARAGIAKRRENENEQATPEQVQQ